MSTPKLVPDQNALSGIPGVNSRLYVKAFILQATEDTYRKLRELPETAPWVDPEANTYVVIIEAMIGQQKIQNGFVLNQGVSNDLMGESAVQALQMAKEEKKGRVRRFLVDETIELLQEVSRNQRKENYESNEKMEKKVKSRMTGNSEKTGFGCDKPWPKKIYEDGKCVENRKQGYKSLTTQLASQDPDNQFCYFFIQENKKTDKEYIESNKRQKLV